MRQLYFSVNTVNYIFIRKAFVEKCFLHFSTKAHKKTTTYNYSDKTSEKDKNLIESVVLPIATITYDYDKFYRASYDVEVNNADILSTDYTFRNSADGTSTSMVVETMTNVGNDWDTKLTYTYDDNGNIETISENDVLKATYYYDDLNQLEREDNVWLGKTIAYTYDNGGNIQLVEEYAYTSGALDGLTATNSYTYLYGDSNWKDKLTSYNGNTITYDEIGNPINYYNGYHFTWQDGRQLAGISGETLTISYKYNSDGIRTSKTVGNVTTTYTLEGSNIVKETNGTDTLWYYYDAADSLIGFEYNGTPYFYVKNLQGDIVAITDNSGNKVVEYLYDSWGKVEIGGTAKDTIGEINPFRYRGYYYDEESELYYVNSRYYDPTAYRFISSDTIAVVSASPGSVNYDKNLFAYCDNDPINREDTLGTAWETGFDIISLFVSFIDVCCNPSDATAWIGLACDAVDLVPFVTGVGEVYKAGKITTKAAKALDTADDTYSAIKTVDKATSATKTVKSSVRRSAVKKAWQNELLSVQNGMDGVSRIWTKSEKVELLKYGKVKGYQGHHMKSVKGYPELAGCSENIQFLTPAEHLKAHSGNWRNITHGRFNYGGD